MMRYVIEQSFDPSEINHYFTADIAPKVGRDIQTKSGKWYRITDVAWRNNQFDGVPDICVLLRRLP